MSAILRPDCWGLTASDSVHGYDAHSPTNDLGVITPTAALASIPFAPDQSMRARDHHAERPAAGGRVYGDRAARHAVGPQGDLVRRLSLRLASLLGCG